MKIRQITETTAGATASGSVASISSPMGEVQSRMQKPPKSPKVQKPKKNTYKNQISEAKVTEEEISEQDLIVVPGMRRSKDTSFIPHEKDRRDHEVEMARSDLAAAAKDAMRIHKILKGRSEDQGLMGWQQSYITLASDYLNSVADSLEYQAANEMTAGVLAGGMSNFEESTQKVDSLVTDALKIMKSPETQDAVKALKTVLGHREYNSRPRFYQFYVQQLIDMYDKQGVAEGNMSNFESAEKGSHLRGLPFAIQNMLDEINVLMIKAKTARDRQRWNDLAKFNDEIEAIEDKIRAKHPKGQKFIDDFYISINQPSIQESKCPHCSGELVHESLMNEKKDACYYKVKSRYKVWPSAYASGALVKCRKKGASNWGKSKK